MRSKSKKEEKLLKKVGRMKYKYNKKWNMQI